MSALYARVLLWHKLVAVCTGGLALCSAKHRLNRDEAQTWIDALENVAADIRQFLSDQTFVLDDKGRRVIGSVDGERASTDREARHGVASEEGTPNSVSGATGRKSGGPRVARKKQ